MATIRFVSSDDVSFATAGALMGGIVDPAVFERFPPDELEQTEVRYFHPGTSTEPQLFEVRLAPGTRAAPHAHEHHEIMVVLDGELSFGSRKCTAGTTVSIPGRTLYALSAGPDGARFLNFRGVADPSYLNKDDLMAARTSSVFGED